MNDQTASGGLSPRVIKAVEAAVRERFGDKVERVEIEKLKDVEGDLYVQVQVILKSKTRESDVENGFFGLTNMVRKALGKEAEGLFPVIRPMMVHA